MSETESKDNFGITEKDRERITRFNQSDANSPDLLRGAESTDVKEVKCVACGSWEEKGVDSCSAYCGECANEGVWHNPEIAEIEKKTVRCPDCGDDVEVDKRGPKCFCDDCLGLRIRGYNEQQ